MVAAIFIVCWNTFKLVVSHLRNSLTYGNKGMEIKLGHFIIFNSKRRGNNGSNRWSGSLSSSFFHHPFRLGQSHISREDEAGKWKECCFLKNRNHTRY